MNDLCILPKLSFEDINDIKSNFDIRFSKICDDFDDKNKNSNLKSALNSLLIYFIEPYVQIQNINQKNYKSKSLYILVNNRKSLEFLLKEINNQCQFLRDTNQDYNKYMEIIQSSFFALDLILEGVTGDDKYYHHNPYRKLIKLWLESFLKLQKFDFLDYTKSQDINIFSSEDLTKPNIEKNNLEEKGCNYNPVRKYSAKEDALALIFDLHANNRELPINHTEGGYSKIVIEEIANRRIDYRRKYNKPNSFYKAFIEVLNYDLNNIKHLQNISNDWQNVLKELSGNYEVVCDYLLKKRLIEKNP